MANQVPAPSAPPAGSLLPQTEEERVAAQRLKNLEEQASRAATEVQAANSATAAAKGDLERANVALAGLREENTRLVEQVRQLQQSAANKDSLPTLPVELPGKAKQLVESVTFATVDADGKSTMAARAKRGDVVIVGSIEDAEKLQASVGQVARVYAVDKATAAELSKLNHVR